MSCWGEYGGEGGNGISGRKNISTHHEYPDAQLKILEKKGARGPRAIQHKKKTENEGKSGEPEREGSW